MATTPPHISPEWRARRTRRAADQRELEAARLDPTTDRDQWDDFDDDLERPGEDEW